MCVLLALDSQGVMDRAHGVNGYVSRKVDREAFLRSWRGLCPPDEANTWRLYATIGEVERALGLKVTNQPTPGSYVDVVDERSQRVAEKILAMRRRDAKKNSSQELDRVLSKHWIRDVRGAIRLVEK